MLRDSAVVVVVAVVRTRPRAIPLPMITMRKSIHGFLFLYGYGALLSDPSGRRSSAIIEFNSVYLMLTMVVIFFVFELISISKPRRRYER